MTVSEWAEGFSPPVNHVDDDASPGVAEACSRLMGALSDLTVSQGQLDGDHLADMPDTNIADALAAVRVARQRCRRLADVVLQARPRSPVEADLRRDTLAAYLTRIEVDQLTLNSVFKPELDRGVPTRPEPVPVAAQPLRGMPWKTWLKLGSGGRLT